MATLREGEWPRVYAELQGRWTGQTALLVAGGLSAANWRELKKRVKPDIVIGVNGAVQDAGSELDFWVTTETTSALRTEWIMDECPKHRIHNWKCQTAPIQRLDTEGKWVETDLRIPSNDKTYWLARVEVHPGFLLRDYGLGLIMGPYGHHLGSYITSVSLQAFHLACLLGCWQVHTVGLDFCVPAVEGDHHFYPDQQIAAKRLIPWKGVQTLRVWLELVRWWKEKIRPMCAQEGIEWTEHSGGLWDLV